MIRPAEKTDVSFIEKLEHAAFDPQVRLSRRDILYSLQSPHQMVVILEEHNRSIGYMIIIEYKRRLRLYSIVVDPSAQGQGHGTELMNHFLNLGQDKRKHLTLEVDKAKQKLVRFYQSFGFATVKELPDYYGDGTTALQMKKPFDHNVLHTIVLDRAAPFLEGLPHTNVVFAHEYINNASYHDDQVKVINLCESYKYQSLGYYVSLLGVARNRIVTPSLTTIRDLSNKVLIKSVAEELDEIIQRELKDVATNDIGFQVYFGFCRQQAFAVLAQELFSVFDLPLFDVLFVKNQRWTLHSIKPIQLSKIPDTLHKQLVRWYKAYVTQTFPQNKLFKPYDYDLAILVNPKEVVPPSDEGALAQFKRAAEDIGFYVEFIEKKDYRKIPEFDALFIRETTDVNNHTYDFSRYAYSEGLVVIDDPWSILKCSNKVFLFELLRKQHIPIPKTRIITKNNIRSSDFKNLAFPIIMKKPDSAFSLGVFKVSSYQEFLSKGAALLKHSDMIVIQEYIETDFDWRVGVLNHQPIYACKYYMVEDDFRIFHLDEQAHGVESKYEGVDLTHVPQEVIDLGVTSASLIGDGLYGVDIKQQGDRFYVIEINDNPSIDSGIEDAILQDRLYHIIMQELYDRIESERYQKRQIR